jgi:hypothetical protein
MLPMITSWSLVFSKERKGSNEEARIAKKKFFWYENDLSISKKHLTTACLEGQSLFLIDCDSDN